jgi:signal transduction histidine kinase
LTANRALPGPGRARCARRRAPAGTARGGDYFIVSETLANAAKHANASVVQVDVESDGSTLRISVRDDGLGGAVPSRGSGLVGLHDRVEALGGAINVRSAHGAGTSVQDELPLSG